MKTVFLNRALEKLYTTGSIKKYRLEDHVVRGFFEVVASLQASKDIHDLQREPSLHFKKMINTENRYSLRITKKYRLEVEIDWENEENTIGVVGIDELSNHYK